MNNTSFEGKLPVYRNAALILLLVVASFSLWSIASSYASRVDTVSRSFAATGEGKVVAVPDIAEFTIGLTTEGGNDLASLQAQNTEKMNAVISFLKSEGVNEKDITTQNYSVSPRYEYSSCQFGGVCPPPKIAGYTVSQSVLVKVRDFKKAGDLLSGAVAKGANNVSQLSFSVDELAALENEAREKAIREAKEKAKATAKAGGFSLGKLLSVEESGTGPIPYFYGKDAVLGMGGEGRSVAPAVEPGSQDIIVNVVLRYEIR